MVEIDNATLQKLCGELNTTLKPADPFWVTILTIVLTIIFITLLVVLIIIIAKKKEDDSQRCPYCKGKLVVNKDNWQIEKWVERKKNN